MDFALYRLQLRFRAREGILCFRPGSTGNLFRSALGHSLHRLSCVEICKDARSCPFAEVCLYRQIFAPSSDGSGPSGYADPPRPLVLRATHLEGARIQTGETFEVRLHVFDLRPATVQALTIATAGMAQDVALESVSALGPDAQELGVIFSEDTFRSPWPPPLRIALDRAEPDVRRIRVRFRTPTEIKGLADPQNPDFASLFARLRDRISTLRAFYGEGWLEIDRALGERALAVRLIQASMKPVTAFRRSGRTGQRHSLGGWVGEAEYAGELGEFLPYLRAGQWTGVGRQTVWGKGEIEVEILD
jgi:hypothetical protein